MAGFWQEFFDNEAETYDQNPFAQHTEAEVDFLLSLYHLPPGSAILDVGCGTGRHSVELAKRGYKVTGLDMSPAMLAKAREKDPAGTVEWVEADATNFALDKVYDAAVCLCEGSLGLIERGEDPVKHDLSVFRNVASHLKPNAPFVLTCLNGYSVIRQMKDEFIADGRFNPATMVSNYMDEWALPSGTKQIQVYERLFIAPEVANMLAMAGFGVDAVYGGTAGHWGRRPLSLDEVEAMFCARKRPE
ncbi:MAG TPA: methyltransferase domain-containing protein [Fimbriimonas sp.]|nr:methyltransferase domain-containing protein [Fimbriimonas sp.]